MSLLLSGKEKIQIPICLTSEGVLSGPFETLSILRVASSDRVAGEQNVFSAVGQAWGCVWEE